MEKKFKVTYLYHSGFLVETERSYMLFVVMGPDTSIPLI